MNAMMPNKGCHELPTAKWNMVLTTVLGLLISFIACTTNVLILIAIYKKPALRSVTNYFLASLAIGDFFVGIVALPLWITGSLLARVADEKHPLNISVDCVYVLSVAVSTYNLCAVSLERYVGVIFPLRYSAIVTLRRFRCAVASVWVLSSFIASLRLAIHEDTYWMIVVSTVFFIPGVIISYCYVCIFKEASRQVRVIGQQSDSALASQVHNKKASITIAIVIGVFFLTALPALAFAINEVVSQDGASCQEKKSLESWGTWALFLAYSNSAINPWIYAARKREFRDALKVLMFWKHA